MEIVLLISPAFQAISDYLTFPKPYILLTKPEDGQNPESKIPIYIIQQHPKHLEIIVYNVDRCSSLVLVLNHMNQISSS
jgi:hypothetical protein